MVPRERIEEAFAKLAEMPGFVQRPDQLQLALLLSDLIEGSANGAIEAPTGLGKSLAALVPALAQAELGKRVVVSTYTNVLAEQYWRKDLPLAKSLFESLDVDCRYLIGRQRYACQVAMEEVLPAEAESFTEYAELGIDGEFRRFARPRRIEQHVWNSVAVPPVCPARLCPKYDSCYYYSARRRAEKAGLVITNHSVVIQDALQKSLDDGEGLLGQYDFLLIDEAHDFVSAVQSGLEFDLGESELKMLQAICTKLEVGLAEAAEAVREGSLWHDVCEEFRESIEKVATDLAVFGMERQRKEAILTASPPDLLQHPQVLSRTAKDALEDAARIAETVARLCTEFAGQTEEFLEAWSDEYPGGVRAAREANRNYLSYIRQMGGEAAQLFNPQGVMVSYVNPATSGVELRSDTVAFAEPLRELIWDKTPIAMISATLAIDGDFDFLRRTLGADFKFEEILPSPFDYTTQAALYIPKRKLPDPSLARVQGTEAEYYDRLAEEISMIIRSMGGRTLVLFHSRREMDEVHERVSLGPDLPILVQHRSGAGAAGDRFREQVESSLFALRSFWTGFDAPGETCQCVVLVRVPFEVPVEPPAVARMAHLQNLGYDPFAAWTLPMAKTLIRQGAGRLIRSADDRGIIALLDSRLKTKRYGEEILANLPAGMRSFDDFTEAMAHIGLDIYEAGWT